MNISLLDITLLLPPKLDSRTKESPEADLELKNSISQFGVLEPIQVKPSGDRFEIIFGHRRYRMASALGFPTMPCIIDSSGEKEIELKKIHENLHRLPNSHVDQGRTFKYLRDKFNMSETEIASLINKSIPYVSQHLTLLESDPDIINAVHTDKITFSAARELVQVKNSSEQKRLLHICITSGVKTDVLHNWVREANIESSPVPTKSIVQQTEPTLPYRNDPTFPCQSCQRITPIAKLTIVRLCPDCNFSFLTAMKQLQEETPTKN